MDSNRWVGSIPLVTRAIGGPAHRGAFAAGGIAAMSMLVLVLMAVHRGLVTGIQGYVRQPGIDLWIAPFGTDNLIRSSALLPEEAEALVLRGPGVRAVDAVVRGFVTADRLGGPSVPPITLLGLGHAPGGDAGPAQLRVGREASGRGESVLDRAAAYRLGVGLGDSIIVAGRRFELVGLSDGTNLLATQFGFFDIREARRVLKLPPQASFLAIRLAPGADPARFTAWLEDSLPEGSVFTIDQFEAANVREVAAGLLPVMRLIAGLGLAVAAILVSLVVRGLVTEHRAELAVLLAVGAGPLAIGAALLARTAALTTIGVAAGSLTMLLGAALVDRHVPTVVLATAAVDHARVLALFLATGFAAAIVPLIELQRVDPLEAFRA